MLVRTEAQWQPILEQIEHGPILEAGRGAIYRSGHEMLKQIAEAGAWRPGDRVVEIGSGNGRLAIPLTEQPGSYLGLEPIESCVAFCRRAFAPWPQLRFEHLDVRNALYNPNGLLEPHKVVFSAPDESADVVWFSSVFSHAETINVCRRNLQEAARVLRPAGRCFTSWFSSPPNDLHSGADRTVFPMRTIVDSFLGWRVVYSNGGELTTFHDQWIVVLERA